MQLDKYVMVEIGENIAGPQTGQIMADLGMTVIKVENPAGGDSVRRQELPRLHGSAAMFHAQNRNKRSLVLDLKDPDHVARLKRFVARRADVVMQNLRPGSIEKLGLAADDLMAGDPRLIYCNIGAYSKAGPNRHKGGYDVLLQGFSGLMSLVGEPDRPPVRIGVSSIDTSTGMWAAIGILGALLEREHTGRGRLVDTSLYEAAMQFVANPVAQYRASGVRPWRSGGQLPGVVPLQPFDASDGQVIIAAANDRVFGRVAKGLGHPEWAEDPRFATGPARFENRETLIGMMQDILGAKPRAHWIEVLDAVDVPVGPVNDVAESVADPEAEAAGIIGKVPGREDIEVVLSPLSFDGTRPGIRRHPPDLGEYNDAFFAATDEAAP